MPEQRRPQPGDPLAETGAMDVDTPTSPAYEAAVLFDLDTVPPIDLGPPTDPGSRAAGPGDPGPPTDPGLPIDPGPPTDPVLPAVTAPRPDRSPTAIPAPRRTSVHPGMLLDGRYQLQHAVSERDGVALWYGEDRVLARAVAIRLVVETDSAPGDALIAAARRSGQLVHSGAASTYDATRTDVDGLPIAYVVSEWVSGISLLELLRDGPLQAERAAAITLSVARVITAGQSAGVSHGDLHPGDVIITAHGLVKVLDMEMRAVSAPYPASERRERDVTGLGAILYACLTGRWPLGSARGLPAAERHPNGQLRSPRQLRAGVPRELDALAMAALGASHNGRQPTAADLVGALEVIVAEMPTGSQPALDDDPEAETPAAQTAKAEQAERLALASRARQRTLRKRVVPIVLLVLLALAAWLIGVGVGHIPGRSGPSARTGEQPNPTSTGSQLSLAPAGVNAFDPEGDSQENPTEVPFAFDGNLATAWQTERYFGSQWAGSPTKTGVGLVVDLGKPVDVTQVRLTFTQPGVVAELRWADTYGASLDGYTVAANSSATPPAVQTLTPRTGAHRFWLVWLTQLPRVSEDNGGTYTAALSEMAFYG